MQRYTSEKTSIATIPRVYKEVQFPKGVYVLDYGCGKYDLAINYMRERNVCVLPYDPYNRSELSNLRTINRICAMGGVKYAVCANVLNVVYEDIVLISILQGIKGLMAGHGKVYLQVYVGDRSGQGKETKKGYQRNQVLAYYIPFVNQVFINANMQISKQIICVTF